MAEPTTVQAATTEALMVSVPLAVAAMEAGALEASTTAAMEAATKRFFLMKNMCFSLSGCPVLAPCKNFPVQRWYGDTLISEARIRHPGIPYQPSIHVRENLNRNEKPSQAHPSYQGLFTCSRHSQIEREQA
jgi:hypothetical protein